MPAIANAAAATAAITNSTMMPTVEVAGRPRVSRKLPK